MPSISIASTLSNSFGGERATLCRAPRFIFPFRDLYRHTAHVPQAQLPQVYGAADVFVFPTLLEGLGLVVLQAMACGLPVIVTPRGPDEVVRDGVDGYVVPAVDSNSIIEALERLYSDAELRLQLGRNARSQAERWSGKVRQRRSR